MQEIFEKIKERLEEELEWSSTHGKDVKFREGRLSGLRTGMRIVKEVAEEYVPDKNVGEIDEVCEWKIDGVYLHCQHDMKIVISCLEDEEYRYNFCPYCGKKIKVVE